MIARAITGEQILRPSQAWRNGGWQNLCYIESLRQRLVYAHHVALLLSYSAGRDAPHERDPLSTGRTG
jgi:hypothetical protein